MSVILVNEETSIFQFEKAIHNHVMFTAGDDMTTICQPLKQHLRIDYFGYLRDEVDDNTKTQKASTILTNCPTVLDFLLFSHNSPEYDSPEPVIYDPSSKYYLEESIAPKWAKAVSENCQVYHCLTKSIKIGENLWERITFGSSSSDIGQLEIYLNNCDLLDKFIAYFRDRAAKLISTAWQTRIVLENLQNQHPFLLNEEQHYTQSRKNFLQDIEPQRYTLLNKQRRRVAMPKSEMRCLSLLGQGRATKEIANILNISPRTVETYWQRSKIRLNCCTRKDLLDILALNKEVF